MHESGSSGQDNLLARIRDAANRAGNRIMRALFSSEQTAATPNVYTPPLSTEDLTLALSRTHQALHDRGLSVSRITDELRIRTGTHTNVPEIATLQRLLAQQAGEPYAAITIGKDFSGNAAFGSLVKQLTGKERRFNTEGLLTLHDQVEKALERLPIYNVTVRIDDDLTPEQIAQLPGIETVAHFLGRANVETRMRMVVQTPGHESMQDPNIRNMASSIPGTYI